LLVADDFKVKRLAHVREARPTARRPETVVFVRSAGERSKVAASGRRRPRMLRTLGARAPRVTTCLNYQFARGCGPEQSKSYLMELFEAAEASKKVAVLIDSR